MKRLAYGRVMRTFSLLFTLALDPVFYKADYSSANPISQLAFGLWGIVYRTLRVGEQEPEEVG